MRTRNATFIAIAATVLASPVAAQDWTWNGRGLSANQWLEIKGVNGQVRATASTSDQIEVEVTKTARRNDPDEVRLQVIQHAGGVTICAVYPTPEGKQPNECRPGEGGRNSVQNNDVKVDFVVRVPRGTNFHGKTVNGGVTVTGLAADVRANTVNGDVRVSTAGVAEASTVNGSINATMGRADWDDILEFETVNGSIILELPEQIDTQVHASTVNGGIDTDYPLTVSGRFGPKRLSGTIGRGGRELSLGTVNGSIEIRRR